MPIPTFTLGYPPDGSSLGNTKTTIRNNLDGTFEAFSVDHQDQNEVSAGTHTKVQLLNVAGSSPPSGLNNGFETLYSQAIAGNGEVFFTRGNSGVGIQLTGPGTPSAIANGFTFLAGGILMQWGSVNAPGSSGTVSYPTAFPNAMFSIQFNYARAVTSNAISFAINSAGTNTNSQFTYYSTSSGSNTLYWIAIGH